MSQFQPNSETKSQNEKDYVENGKNKMIVKCKFCGSKILDKNSGNYITHENVKMTKAVMESVGGKESALLLGVCAWCAKELPLMQQDLRSDQVQHENLKDFYHVENMYTFDNIGFTHTVDKYKYLSCADCDAGPIGYYDMDTKHSYVAVERIVHA